MCTGTADFIASAALEPRSADCVAGAVAHKTKACYVGMTTSSSKFYLARLTKGLQRWNGPSGWLTKKGLLRLVIKGLLQCFTGCMTRFPNHLERVLPRKCRPKDPKTRTKDQRTKGPEDQGTRGPRDQGTRGPRDQRTKGPGQREQRTKRSGNQQARTKGVEVIFCLIRLYVF